MFVEKKNGEYVNLKVLLLNHLIWRIFSKISNSFYKCKRENEQQSLMFSCVIFQHFSRIYLFKLDAWQISEYFCLYGVEYIEYKTF